MNSVSETVGRTSSRGTDGTSSSAIQKPKRARAGTNRGNLELDQPLDHIDPPLQATYRTRRGVYAPTRRTGIKRSFWCNTIFGLIMIGVLVFGSIFGVIFAIIETKGALRAGGTPDYNTSTDSVANSTPFVATTLVPSSFSTLVSSSYLTLVPTEITVYIESEAITLVHSDTTSLIQSLVTLTQRDTITSVKIATISPTGLVKKRGDITSTIGLTKSVTTTVTIRVYSTTFGYFDMQSEFGGNGDSQQTCGNGAQNPCMSTINITSDTQSTFVISTLSTGSASLLDVNATTATTDMPDSTTTSAMTTTNIPETSVDKVTITYSISMVRSVTDVSSMLTCSPVPTGCYISPSAPRATSVLHPVFRFISSSLFGFKDKGIYQFLRLNINTAWKQCGKVFINTSCGKALNNFLNLLFTSGWNLKMWEYVGPLAKGGGMPPKPLIPRGA